LVEAQGMNMAERATVIRNHALALVRQRGERQEVRGSNHLLAWNAAPWIIVHMGPFAPPAAGNPALDQQPGEKRIGYTLDVFRRGKVFSAQWGQEGEPQVITFKRGRWEDDLLSL